MSIDQKVADNGSLCCSIVDVDESSDEEMDVCMEDLEPPATPPPLRELHIFQWYKDYEEMMKPYRIKTAEEIMEEVTRGIKTYDKPKPVAIDIPISIVYGEGYKDPYMTELRAAVDKLKGK